MILPNVRPFARFLVSTFTLAVLAWGLLPAAVQGQDLVQVYITTPEQGGGPRLEAAMQKHADWREENGDPWEWNVYEVVQGKNQGAFIIRSPNHAWKDFDDYSQGFGPRGEAHYERTVAPMTASISSSIVQTVTEETQMPEDMSGYSLFEVHTYKLKPARGSDFVDAHQKYFQAVIQESDDRYLETVDVLNGAEDDAVRLVTPYKNWAGFESPDPSADELLQEAYGEEEAENLFEQFGNSYRSSYDMVVRYRPDLSVEPQQ